MRISGRARSSHKTFRLFREWSRRERRRASASTPSGWSEKGFNEERRKTLQRAFRLLLRSKLNTSQALAKMREQFAASADVIELVQFIETAERGIVK